MAPDCHLALPLVAHSPDLPDLVHPPVSRVQELAVVTDLYLPMEHQDFHQVALEATLELDSPTPAPSVDVEVSD